MSTVVICNKNTPAKGIFTFNLSDEAKQRAREHLKSAGIHLDQVPELIWPDDAVSARQDDIYAPWQFTTTGDLLRERRETMDRNLRRKREYRVSQRRALYIWVFWCPGVSGVFYRGWWTYIIGRDVEYGDKYQNARDAVIERLMKLFPLVEPTLFGPPDFDKWMAEFVKRYQRGKWCGKPQGKAPIWCEVYGGEITKILERAEWPKQGGCFER